MARKYENPLKTRFSSEFFAGIPRSAGVYFMKCAKGEVLYIGKATVLRARVRSYRNARPDTVGKNIIKMLERVRSIEWEIHANEEEAFRRELELIRAFVPRYNIADAWEERYLFIGVRSPRKGQIEFRLTYKEEEAAHFKLHGCYPRRSNVKEGYAALLRILFACSYVGDRFSFPSRITRPAPAYEYILKIEDSTKWLRMISDFLNGQKSKFLQILVERLLANPHIPEYVRQGLQRDIISLSVFEKVCLRLAATSTAEKKLLSHRDLREELQRSIIVALPELMRSPD